VSAPNGDERSDPNAPDGLAEDDPSDAPAESPPLNFAPRLENLVAELRKITPNVAATKTADDILMSPDDLAASSDTPLIPKDSPDDLRVVLLNDTLLVATRASTGKTLLQDYAEIKAYQRRIDALETPTVKRDSLTAIETTDLQPRSVDPLFAALDLPTKDYFRAALESFVTDDRLDCVAIVRDGLLDAINSRKPATVHLLRDYLIADTSMGGTITLYRSALAHPGVTMRDHPVIGFRTATTNRLDVELESAFTHAQTIFLIASPDRGPERLSLPAPLAQQALKSFGYKSDVLDFFALDIAEYAKGESVGYLSTTLRTRF
jgi:hypothetical protein